MIRRGEIREAYRGTRELRPGEAIADFMASLDGEGWDPVSVEEISQHLAELTLTAAQRARQEALQPPAPA